MLRDLTDLALHARDTRSRQNILEAITCYEAGAYRAAIASTWTAVAYDLIYKILELAVEGDAEAKIFEGKFHNAQNNQNIDQLLSIEKGIIDLAFDKFQMLDLAERESLSRLRDDRHKSAHPAFVADDRIFEPAPELARCHIAAALDSVLTKPPVFGKVILDRYTAAISKNLFPAGRDDVISYVKSNFLDKIRESFLRNFCIVIGKALLKVMPPEWAGGRRRNLTYSLIAVSIHEKLEWQKTVRHEIVRLEETATIDGRRTFIGLMALIPSLRIAINQEFLDRAKIAIESFNPAGGGYNDVFLGVRVPELKEYVLRRFAALSDEEKGDVVKSVADLEFWTEALRIFSTAASFRGAEAMYATYITPFNSELKKDHLLGLLKAVIDNGQIWDAAGTPDSLLNTVVSADLTGMDSDDLSSFRDGLHDNRRLAKYKAVFDAFRQKGIDMLDDQNCRFEDAVPF
jgi:hypothetical protein